MGLRHRGGILVTVLVYSLIIAILLAGIGSLVASHSTLGIRMADRSAALELAEGGINYELWWISQNPADAARPHQAHPAGGQNGAYTSGIGVVPGTFTVSVTNDPDDGTPWYAPKPPLITCTGLVNGMSRTVQVRGLGKGMFDVFPVFSIGSMNVTGTGSQVIGNTGTDGPVTVSSGAGASAFVGTLTFWGTPATLAGSNVEQQPQPITWATIDQIALGAFPSGGLPWLKLNNNNDSLKQFNPNRIIDPLFSLSNAVSAGFTKTSYTISSGTTGGLTTDLSPFDVAGGTRYCTSSEGLFNQRVLIFPPGDYYFESVDAGGGKSAWLIDTASGRVRIWIGGTGVSKDSLGTVVIFTSNDPAKFRLYYNKASELAITGNSTFNGGIYAARSGATSSIKLSGGTSVNGSVIGQIVTVSGGSIIHSPPTANIEAADFPVWYGFIDRWKEIP